MSSDIFEVDDGQDQPLIRVTRYTDAPLQVCFRNDCYSFPIDSSEFRWNFIGISVDQSAFTFCSKTWLATALTCTSHTSSQVILTENSKAKSFDSNELYDLQFIPKALTVDDLVRATSIFKCLTVCPSCYGPSPTACNEFLPVVRLSQIFEVEKVDYTEDSVPFRGKQFPIVENIALAGWIRLQSISNFIWYDILRLWTEE